MSTKFALEDITIEQSKWKDNSANHSIAELTSHLLFWNERNRYAFKGNPLADFSDDNEFTFKKYENVEWHFVAQKLDSV